MCLIYNQMELHEHNHITFIYCIISYNIKYKDLVCNIAFSLALCSIGGALAIYCILCPNIGCKGILNFGLVY